MPNYETSVDAEQDLQKIIDYTVDRHGPDQVRVYISDLDHCANNLAQRIGHYKNIPAQGKTIRVKHCQHHYIFGFDREDAPFLIIAIFHERMDLMQRLKNRLS